jgi:DNA gyrase subunit B
MYFGNPDETGLNRCLWELVANSAEQHLMGKCSSIVVTIHNDDSISVEDDGPGVSTAVDVKYKAPFIELAFTCLNYAYKAPSEARFAVSGLTGVGAKCVNAVSEWMRIETGSRGEWFCIRFAKGRVNEPLHRVAGPGAAQGTNIRFKPDPEIFKRATFNRQLIAHVLQPLAILHPALDVWLIDERSNSKSRPLVWQLNYPGGIAHYLKTVTAGHWTIHPDPVVFIAEANGIKCALGFQFTYSTNCFIQNFANCAPTTMGGTHVDGFLLGLAEALNRVVTDLPAFSPHDLRSGLFAVVAVWLTAPRYGGSTKDSLINTEVEEFTRNMTRNGLERWIVSPSQEAERVIDWLDKERRRRVAGTNDSADKIAD